MAGQRPPLTAGADDDRYWRARKSLRLWPIIGPDLQAAVTTYLVDTLQMERDIIDDVQHFKIRRVRSARGKHANEVIIKFPDVETRDAVRSAAPKLAGRKDLGMRLEIPESLRPSLRALESVSYLMKKNNPALKRNVKFDDETLDLVMDLSLIHI